MASALFRTKSIDRLLSEAGATGERTLKRTLGGWSLVALGIGGIIGAGIFVRTAAAIAERSGPAVTVAFIVAAAVGVVTELSQLPLATRVFSLRDLSANVVATLSGVLLAAALLRNIPSAEGVSPNPSLQRTPPGRSPGRCR